MSTHNIGFYEEISKNTPLYHQIRNLISSSEIYNPIQGLNLCLFYLIHTHERANYDRIFFSPGVLTNQTAPMLTLMKH